jgi:hypothetical protein
LPALAADNRAIDRALVLTERAASETRSAYGPLVSVMHDDGVHTPTLSNTTRDVPDGTRYALCVLKPSRDMSLDADDLARAIQQLGGPDALMRPQADYFAMIGVKGRRPEVLVESNLPFSQAVKVDGVPTEIRMESWLSSDTIRRMGFGHVIAARQHT